MFTGEYRHTVDSKGRISLPAAYRRALPEQIMVCKGFDGTLFVFTPQDYAEWLDSLVPDDDFDPEIKALYRMLTAGAMTVDLDTAGRMSVSPYLREYAGLDKDVVVIGNRKRLEVWDAKRWDDYNASHGTIDELVSKVRSKKSQ